MKRATIEPPTKEKVWEHYAKSRRGHHKSLGVSHCTQTYLATSDSTSPIPQIITYEQYKTHLSIYFTIMLHLPEAT